MCQQGFPHSLASHVTSYSMPAMSSIEQWQNQQTASGGFQQSGQNELPPSQTDQNLRRSDVSHECEMSADGPAICSEHLDHISRGSEPNSVISASAGTAQEQNMMNLKNHVLEDQDLTVEVGTAGSLSHTNTSVQSVNSNETTIINGTGAVLPKKSVTTGQNNTLMSGKISETALLDEKALLACIVRTIPNGGRTRINSTLPNRLGKMLAPLHWHDYKKKYGKLDDFVANHLELFVINGDYIQLREGAQEMIEATTAVAKVAAATAATSPQSTSFPSVAVTPIVQPNRLKKVLT
ncbi:uncharacterized protein LOC120120902 [Hibiscus syriacus]|nr:uncharacterized protein LOC120120902 [Hibiscus syriacus]